MEAGGNWAYDYVEVGFIHMLVKNKCFLMVRLANTFASARAPRSTFILWTLIWKLVATGLMIMSRLVSFICW